MQRKNQETTVSRFVQSVVQLILDLQKVEMQTVEKPMLKCSCCHKRFTYDNGQNTLFPPGRIKVGPAYRRYLFTSASRKVSSEYEYKHIYSLAYANEAASYA